ncbi:DAK2 domain-containing protein [Frankia sp. CNm7]|uniref:DAK2 domain-containing protein n=1 Tax=Frankia nepalensis TaxID=1836974 RepID=A0A937RJ02_9ACTN|nr:DAK2 domain-containing protein [Frankia nepalensis]MBL7499620.1 DAK2 domain-containing protein [Frankia nepalensis]MBL7514543.1 DAK2 domain-containing protein [Frankia nepalensis]MBL7522220.1 DAK2 domain-containing protein [Frankia nepalensis]MBL7626846.1 DAK2 domain-containing protein [Frankia nepalensis]
MVDTAFGTDEGAHQVIEEVDGAPTDADAADGPDTTGVDATGSDGADVHGLDLAGASAWFDAFHRRFEAEAAALGDLDRRAGDGDFGNNILSALRRCRRRLDEEPPRTPGELFLGVSHGFLNTGGTSGPLFGMWFRGIGRATDAPVMTLGALAAGVADGTATVQRLGKARPGDKTMVDAMAPATDALAAAVDAGLDLPDGLARAADAARAGALATESLRARRGRAAYVGDVARGVLDPGALTVALFFSAGPPAPGRL